MGDGAATATPLDRLSASLHVGVDRALLGLFRQAGARPDERDLDYRARLLAEMVTVHERNGWTDPASYLAAPPPLTDPRSRDDRVRGVDIVRWSWPSEHTPHPSEPGADAWMARRRNQIARAWTIETKPDAPWLVCLHGHSAGMPTMDLTGFHATHVAALGVNLAFVVLPRHGRRREAGWDPGGFLTGDVVQAVHGTSQAVWDVRRLLGWLREVRGATRIGLYGVSLGSWVAGTVAGLEDDLSLVIAGIPLVDVADLFRRHAPDDRRDAAIEAGALGPLADRLIRVVSPLHVEPHLPVAARRVYAGQFDQLTSAAQAERLIEHWGSPEHHWFAGGHVGFVWSRAVRDAVDAAIRDRLLDDRTPAQ